MTLQGSWQWEPMMVSLGEALGQNEGWGPGLVRTSWSVRAGDSSQGPSHLPCGGIWGTLGEVPTLLIGLLLGDREGTRLRWMSHSRGCTCHAHRTTECEMSLSLPAHPGEHGSRESAAWTLAKICAPSENARDLQSRLLLMENTGHCWDRRTLRQTSRPQRNRVVSYQGFWFNFCSLWCCSHKSRHFFSLNCFSVCATLGRVGWVWVVSVSHQDWKLGAREDGPSRKDKWRCVGRRNGGPWTPCICGYMHQVYLVHRAGNLWNVFQNSSLWGTGQHFKQTFDGCLHE